MSDHKNLTFTASASQSNKKVTLIYEGRTHPSHCEFGACGGIPFDPALFPTKGANRYENCCKDCYNIKKQEYRKAKSKKKKILKKAHNSRANNKTIDLDDFEVEVVSITDSIASIEKRLTNLTKEILCAQKKNIHRK